MAGGYNTPDVDPYDALVRKLAEAEARLSELERPTGTQSAQAVKTLQAQVATLVQQQADIVDLLGTQVSPQSGSASTTGFTLGTSQANIATFNVTTPAGFTRVVISAVGFVGIATTGSSASTYARINIASNFGPEALSLGNTAYPYANATASFSVSLSGISGVLPISIQGRYSGGGTSSVISSANVTATALFLK